jgi:hypothetical protein
MPIISFDEALEIITKPPALPKPRMIEPEIHFCVCRHEILPPKLPGFLPSCRNDNCKTKWWNRI